MLKYSLDEVLELLNRLRRGENVDRELTFILSELKLNFLVKLIEAYYCTPEVYKEYILDTIIRIVKDLKDKYSVIVEDVRVPCFEVLRRGLKPIAIVEIASREYIVLADSRGKLYFMRVNSKSPKTIPERVIREAMRILDERGELDFDILKDRTGKYTEAALAILALAKLYEDKYEVVYDEYGYPVKLRRKNESNLESSK